MSYELLESQIKLLTPEYYAQLEKFVEFAVWQSQKQRQKDEAKQTLRQIQNMWTANLRQN